MKLKVEETPAGREWQLTLTEREAMHLSREALLVQSVAEKIPYEFLALKMRSNDFVSAMRAKMRNEPEHIVMLIAFAIFEERTRVGDPLQKKDSLWMAEEMVKNSQQQKP